MKYCVLAAFAALLPSWSVLTTASAAEKALFDLSDKFDLTQVETVDATVSLAGSSIGPAFRIRTGHRQPWPGITLRAPGGRWDLSLQSEVTLKVVNVGTNSVTVSCRVDNPGADGRLHCVNGSLKLGPGKTGTLKVPLNRTSGDQLNGGLFGMRGYPVVAGGPETIEPTNITQLLVFVAKPEADFAFEVGEIRATGTWTPPTAWVSDATPFFPFIDALGQYRHKDWPGKAKSAADLAARRQQEARDLAEQPGPKDWDKFGGWATGPQLKATGFFRTEKVKGKWWLVDPEGRLFFSHGLDCVGMLDKTPIDERESWFEACPAHEAQFSELLSHDFALKGHYEGHRPECFSFAGANLARKYGTDWKQVSARVVHQRLRSWGLNTLGDWSDENLRLMRLTAYTDAIGSEGSRMIEGSEGYWGKFPDVFDPSFGKSLERAMEYKKGKSAGDPWCIGYFSDNEMSWGDDFSIAVGALKSGPAQPAKQALVADLKARYGSVAKLNAVWGTTHASWEALLDSRQVPERQKAGPDLGAFYTKAAEQYFRGVRQAIKAVAPSQLYLGCRFAAVNPRAAAAAARFADVVSYNIYQRSMTGFQFDGGADVPLLIGEFHFGALDRGMFHPGLVPVVDQSARGRAYREYLQGALSHPQFVGCHWFQYQDEPTTGRVWDEENYQIGFVDVADTPYAETIAASRDVGYRLYR